MRAQASERRRAAEHTKQLNIVFGDLADEKLTLPNLKRLVAAIRHLTALPRTSRIVSSQQTFSDEAAGGPLEEADRERQRHSEPCSQTNCGGLPSSSTMIPMYTAATPRHYDQQGYSGSYARRRARGKTALTGLCYARMRRLKRSG